MELKIIDSRAFEKLSQAVKELLEKTNRLNSSGTEKEWLDNQDVCILFEAVNHISQNIQNHTSTIKSSISGEYFLDNNEACEMLHISSRAL